MNDLDYCHVCSSLNNDRLLLMEVKYYIIFILMSVFYVQGHLTCHKIISSTRTGLGLRQGILEYDMKGGDTSHNK